jgi:hypothetical protein
MYEREKSRSAKKSAKKSRSAKNLEARKKSVKNQGAREHGSAKARTQKREI